MTEEKKCVFCKKPKGTSWRSDVAIVFTSPSKSRPVTVCPSCRNRYTVRDLYVAYIEEEAAELRALLKNVRSAK